MELVHCLENAINMPMASNRHDAMVENTIEMINEHLNMTRAPNPIGDKPINRIHIRKYNQLARFTDMTQKTQC